MSRLKRSARHSDDHQSRFVQADEGEEQPNSDREAVAQRDGNALHNPAAKMQNGHKDKQHARQKDRCQRRLPAEAKHLANRESDESVFAHIRRYGEGTVGIERHQITSHGRNQRGGYKRGALGNSGRG